MSHERYQIMDSVRRTLETSRAADSKEEASEEAEIFSAAWRWPQTHGAPKSL